MKKTLLLKNNKNKILSLINKIKNLGHEIHEHKSSAHDLSGSVQVDKAKAAPVVDMLTISYMKYLEGFNKELGSQIEGGEGHKQVPV